MNGKTRVFTKVWIWLQQFVFARRPKKTLKLDNSTKFIIPPTLKSAQFGLIVLWWATSLNNPMQRNLFIYAATKTKWSVTN
jgi:hypothetical protein